MGENSAEKNIHETLHAVCREVSSVQDGTRGKQQWTQTNEHQDHTDREKIMINVTI
jgi:hypothetical protein